MSSDTLTYQLEIIIMINYHEPKASQTHVVF